MNKRRIGNSRVDVELIALGGNVFDRIADEAAQQGKRLGVARYLT
jgi:hypothetical protein